MLLGINYLIDSLDRYPRSGVPCFDWESLYHHFQGNTYLYLQDSRWVLERRSIALSKKGCIWDCRTNLSLSSSYFWKSGIQEKELCDTDFRCHNRLLTVKQWVMISIQQLFHSLSLEQHHSLKKPLSQLPVRAKFLLSHLLSNYRSQS